MKIVLWSLAFFEQICIFEIADEFKVCLDELASFLFGVCNSGGEVVVLESYKLGVEKGVVDRLVTEHFFDVENIFCFVVFHRGFPMHECLERVNGCYGVTDESKISFEQALKKEGVIRKTPFHQRRIESCSSLQHSLKLESRMVFWYLVLGNSCEYSWFFPLFYDNNALTVKQLKPSALVV